MLTKACLVFFQQVFPGRDSGSRDCGRVQSDQERIYDRNANVAELSDNRSYDADRVLLE